MLSDKQKKAIFWSVYFVAILVIVFGIVVPWLIQIYGSVLFPESDIKSIQESVQNASVILSFASVLMGVVSVWQANSGTKEMGKALQSIEEIKRSQERLTSFIHKPTVSVFNPNVGDLHWKPDDVQE